MCFKKKRLYKVLCAGRLESLVNIYADFQQCYFHFGNEFWSDADEFWTFIGRVFDQHNPAASDQSIQVVTNTHFRVIEEQKKFFQIDGLGISMWFIEKYQYVIRNKWSIHWKIFLRNLSDLKKQFNDSLIFFQKFNLIFINSSVPTFFRGERAAEAQILNSYRGRLV